MDVKENVTETTILNKNKEAIPLHGIMQNSDEMEPSPMSTSDTVYLFAAQDEDTPRRSNIFLTSFNCINSILGSGIIAMPYAIYRAGPIFGLILMALMALLTDYSLVILVKAGGIIGVNTYQVRIREHRRLDEGVAHLPMPIGCDRHWQFN
ncbi:SLC38A11 (predicted) [Pycnogonum litorale]